MGDVVHLLRCWRALFGLQKGRYQFSEVLASREENSVNSAIANIAAYKFVALENLADRRAAMRQLCEELQLKGTVLLSTEGINLFLAGATTAIERFLDQIRSEKEFADLNVKVSFSDKRPFRRLLVKIKKEIIAFDDGELQPQKTPSPKIDAKTLKKWLDEKRPITLLDTRNDYEIKLGSFENAVSLGIDNFREFADKIAELPEPLKEQPVVVFCTGGIRCEKAGPHMEQAGFEKIYQLDGGILKYFEECGSAHYDGECFVFDQRVSLDEALSETDTAMCFVCQAPLTVEEQQSELYVPDQSCPHCFVESEQAMEEIRGSRNLQFEAVTHPLPGCVPYENRRPMHVPGRLDNKTLLEFVCELHPHVTREAWIQLIEQGRLQRECTPLSAETQVRAGDRIEHVIPNTVEPDVSADIRLIFEDEALVVINKPAPLPMHPCGRFNRNTLIRLIEPIYQPQKLRVAHRLDANTTGVTVFARTRPFAAKIQPQFENNQVEKVYLVRVHGQATAADFSVDEPIGKNAIRAGARELAPEGLPARTNFRVVREFEDGTSLLEARPVTGRTNQIRLHLVHHGLPVVGDQTYRASEPATTLTHALDDPPLCLHAWKISFQHPVTDERVTYQGEPPAWAQAKGN